MFIFHTRPFWKTMGVPINKVQKKYREFFGEQKLIIDKRDDALKLLRNIIKTIQDRMVNKLKCENSYDLFLTLYYIFDEVHCFIYKKKKQGAN